MRKVKILIVEDYQAVRDLYKDQLTEAGYDVDIAADGQEGLEKILGDDYDLVLLDLLMPKKDGLEVLKELQKKDKKQKIVVMYVVGEEKSAEKAKKLDTIGSINKSLLSPKQLVKEIEKILQKK